MQQPRAAVALATLLALAGCLGLAAAQGGADRVAAPVVAWSDQPYFAGPAEGRTATTSAQVFGDAAAVLKQLLSQALEPGSASAAAQRPAEVVLLVLGTQLKTSDLHSRALHAQLQPLRALLEGAASSLSMPYVLHEVLPAAVHRSKLVQLASEASPAVAVLGCEHSQRQAPPPPQQQQQQLDAALQQLGSDPAIVVVCTDRGEAAPGTRQAVEAELQQLSSAHASVAALGKRHATLFAVTPDADTVAPGGHARQLQGVSADVGSCGQLCQTQVKWLEGILAAFILAIAAFSGMCCLYMLDTPTRFEKQADGARNE